MNIQQYTEPLTIGDFIAKLEQQRQTNRVTFDLGGLEPTTFDSYRGFYDQLALGFDFNHNGSKITVEELIKKSKDAQYNTFEGYKGGYYTMSPDTYLWVDNYGCYNSTAIVDVTGNDYQTVIVTAWIDS